MKYESLAEMGYTYHHSAMRAEYCSRRTEYTIKPYKGKFGEGYIVLFPNYRSTNYSPCEYWVK